MGSGAWLGARNTILTTWDRLNPIKKKGKETKENHGSAWPIILCGLVSISAVVALYAAKNNALDPISFFKQYIISFC